MKRYSERRQIGNLRDARKAWVSIGGKIVGVRRTGEERWSHPQESHSLTLNSRRKDTPAKAKTWINRWYRQFEAANDPNY